MTSTQAKPDQLPEPLGFPGGGLFVRVGRPDREAALGCLLGATGRRSAAGQVGRFLAMSEERGIRLDLMWARHDATGEIAGVVLAVPSPGRTAMLFSSPPRSRADIEAQAPLIDHACRSLADENVQLAQVLLDPGDRLARDAFVAGGLHDLALLGYMERAVPARGQAAAPTWPDGVTATRYTDADEAALREVLTASYVATLDCPGLRGLRHTDDILAGHRATGEFDPDLWTLLRDGDRPIGALLLNPSAATHTVELVYIGLAQPSRNTGLGRLLLRHGLRLIAGRSESTITLAVDESNAPAVRLYRREGFRRALRRRALIRPIRRAND